MEAERWYSEDYWAEVDPTNERGRLVHALLFPIVPLGLACPRRCPGRGPCGGSGRGPCGGSGRGSSGPTPPKKKCERTSGPSTAAPSGLQEAKELPGVISSETSASFLAPILLSGFRRHSQIYFGDYFRQTVLLISSV
ncbi:hypothetical protein MMC07_004889 [Pseudocyphellaria aurata]|nr:hypothetical protein [Pseudocyphellaria aurata]